ncbi:hypothetical protein FJ692_15945 [Pseudomonas fluorescens]|uniref:Uncharacterized protein n=1 Tax=Pseudomonas fluorescens TaxID=294 RepID=A0A2T0II73_PSEFL|nr:hypothetical protein C1751_23540 [Pseudomonas fluorescens]PRW77653.1 hypothetical protein C7A12_10985 [Pseudomonas fluorescens]PRW79681.1 hypothetical protein C7A13_10590 [Pseudomonas fluorescens]PRW95021.1 hypothetical protein C7A10_00545 [Pseudomonas fluorescens]TPV56395.1 hypothetical protein FJ692_15945 [Pseudomonas fluorescens]
MWRGSLLPLGCAAAPKPSSVFYLNHRVSLDGAASPPSGSKLPRHRCIPISRFRGLIPIPDPPAC